MWKGPNGVRFWECNLCNVAMWHYLFLLWEASKSHLGRLVFFLHMCSITVWFLPSLNFSQLSLQHSHSLRYSNASIFFKGRLLGFLILSFHILCTDLVVKSFLVNLFSHSSMEFKVWFTKRLHLLFFLMPQRFRLSSVLSPFEQLFFHSSVEFKVWFNERTPFYSYHHQYAGMFFWIHLWGGLNN